MNQFHAIAISAGKSLIFDGEPVPDIATLQSRLEQALLQARPTTGAKIPLRIDHEENVDLGTLSAVVYRVHRVGQGQFDLKVYCEGVQAL